MSEPIGAELTRPGDKVAVLIRSGNRIRITHGGLGYEDVLALDEEPGASRATWRVRAAARIVEDRLGHPPGSAALRVLATGPRPHGGIELGTLEVFECDLQRNDAKGRSWVQAEELLAVHADGALDLDPQVLRAIEQIAGVPGKPAVPHAFSLQRGIWWVALRTRTLPPATHTNCFIVGGRTLTVVDPGSHEPAEQQRLAEVLAAMRSRGNRVARVVLTHHHTDHIAGVAPLLTDGVELWAHPAAASRLDGLTLDRELEDGDTAIPGWTVHHTPGHCADHLVLRHESSKAVIGGDLVAAVGTIVVSPPDGNMADYFRSLALVRSLRPSVLYPSHGPPITAPDAHLAAYLAHRQQREDEVVAALAEVAAPATALELVPIIYKDVPRAVWPLAARNVVAHLEKLAEEGRATVDDDGRWQATS